MSTIAFSACICPNRPNNFLRRLAILLAFDEARLRPPVSLPGRPVVVVPSRPSSPASPRSSPLPGRKYGCVDVACDSVLHHREQEPDDVLPPYTRDRLAAMNDKFVRRLERAFKSGRERRASAASSGGHRMAPIALTDDQLVTLRQFATPIPPSLRDVFLRSVARRLAAVEVGDGTVYAACAAAQREVIDGTRASE